MALDSSILKINCYCGKKSELDRSEQEKIFGKKVLISDISNFYEKLTCSNCKKKYPQIIDKNENIIFDTYSTNRCINCDCLISKPREEIFPGTNICGNKCSENISESYNQKLKEIQETYDYSSGAKDFQKPPILDLNNPIIRQLTLELSSRRSVMPRLIFKLKNKEITKDQYEISFKSFTWWIKEILEKVGGGIYDDPRKYMECEICHKPASINWTNKFNCYFISCSSFSETKCGWIKNPWYFPSN